MSDDVNYSDDTGGYDDDLYAGHSLEKQILMDLLVTSAGFGLVVTAVVLTVEALSVG